MARVTVDENFNAENFDKGGLPAPGKAHMSVEEVDVRDKYVAVTCVILAHEDESMVNRQTYNTFNLSGKGVSRLLSFCLACGVVTREQYAEWFAEEGCEFDIPVEKTVDRSYCGELEHSDFKGKKRCKVEWDFIDPFSEEAKEFPRSKAFLKEEKKLRVAMATQEDDDEDDDDLAF